jgi:hypothetical protein
MKRQSSSQPLEVSDAERPTGDLVPAARFKISAAWASNLDT